MHKNNQEEEKYQKEMIQRLIYSMIQNITQFLTLYIILDIVNYLEINKIK